MYLGDVMNGQLETQYRIRQLPDGKLPARFSSRWELVNVGTGERLTTGELSVLQQAFPLVTVEVTPRNQTTP